MKKATTVNETTEESDAVAVAKRTYYMSTIGQTVEAASYEEAAEIANSIEVGDAQEEGDVKS